MLDHKCPYCDNILNRYERYLYCFSCSRQFRERLFGRGVKEVENTIMKDQEMSMDRQ